MSTTMAFVRLLTNLLKDATLGPRIVPIVADEARTFGMANLFKQVGIYSSVGQQYAPEDIGSILAYREAKDGQILEEGISEAGALASWTAAATSYSVHGLAMLPFYIYYSMFGFQRVGDAIWAAADQRARGFLIGRHQRAHHPGRRRPAAPGRHQPPGGGHHPQLQGLRPGLCRGAGRHHRHRHARNAGRAARCFLLPHHDERRTTPSPTCRTVPMPACCAALIFLRAIPAIPATAQALFHLKNTSPCWALGPS